MNLRVKKMKAGITLKHADASRLQSSLFKWTAWSLMIITNLHPLQRPTPSTPSLVHPSFLSGSPLWTLCWVSDYLSLCWLTEVKLRPLRWVWPSAVHLQSLKLFWLLHYNARRLSCCSSVANLKKCQNIECTQPQSILYTVVPLYCTLLINILSFSVSSALRLWYRMCLVCHVCINIKSQSYLSF